MQRLEVYYSLVHGRGNGPQGLVECGRAHAALHEPKIADNLLYVVTYLSCLRLRRCSRLSVSLVRLPKSSKWRRVVVRTRPNTGTDQAKIPSKMMVFFILRLFGGTLSVGASVCRDVQQTGSAGVWGKYAAVVHVRPYKLSVQSSCSRYIWSSRGRGHTALPGE